MYTLNKLGVIGDQFLYIGSFDCFSVEDYNMSDFSLDLWYSGTTLIFSVFWWVYSRSSISSLDRYIESLMNIILSPWSTISYPHIQELLAHIWRIFSFHLLNIYFELYLKVIHDVKIILCILVSSMWYRYFICDRLW